ncbi:hypothetical protein K2173_026700 [Erythroxylum novogranatense]|uniref:DNA-directed RNA polymerase III subunit RPC3 n=1 Tax=Erythroxylum novogranatense TaxID=1862640 RepID=A0AAV8TXB0_9ROSI|nr:hypothetical protein K2173_026700 [Erythroxylum novogranatense]
MATQHGIKFALHIITNHFGNLVAKVCECLLRRGPLSLQHVIRYTELSKIQVKNSLLVLIQHNCVQAFYLDEPDAPKSTQYMVLFDNIIHRVRFSKFLVTVSQEFDKMCVDLTEALLQHGRLTLNQIHDRFNSIQKEGNSISLDAVQENLHKLVTSHYVERCPLSEPVLTQPDQDEVPARKRGAKSSKIIVEPETLEQRVIAAAVPVEAKRFSLITDDERNADAVKDKCDSCTEHVGEKRKYDALESDVDSGGTEEQAVLWRVNFDEFIRRLRHKACTENIRTRLDDGAAIVISAMLEASRKEEKKVKTAKSAPLSLDSIYEEVIKNEMGRNMTFDHVRASLFQLSSGPPFVIVEDDSYIIDFKCIMKLAQSDEVESVVLKRYGKDAYRIFRSLSEAGRLLETDKISDTVFVEKKETTNILYKMWQDNYIHMEKIVVGTTIFLLWKINKETLWKTVLDEMFHAALNLSIRMAYELEQQQEVLNLPADRREGPMKVKFERLKKVRMLLESSQMKLDDAIMLFHDF